MEGGGSPSLLPMVGGVQIEQVGGGLVSQSGFSGNSTESLLPSVPAIGGGIERVQGGGGECLSGKCKPYGWYSVPLLSSISVQRAPTAEAKDLKSLTKFWSSIRPDSSDVLVAQIDAVNSTVYVVAPLRGDVTAANDIISWASQIATDPKTYVIFSGSLREGGSEKDGDMIEGMLCFLMSRYPGRILCVLCEDSGPSICPVDGIILTALPHTSRRVFLGSIPSPRSVNESYEHEVGGATFEVMDVNPRHKVQHTHDMFSLTFKKPRALYNREKEPKSQDIRGDRVWGAPPGWVTRVEFQTRDPLQKGGKGGGGGGGRSFGATKGARAGGPLPPGLAAMAGQLAASSQVVACDPGEDGTPECPVFSEGAKKFQADKVNEAFAAPGKLLKGALGLFASKPKVPTPPAVPTPPHVPGTPEPLEKQICDSVTKIVQDSKAQTGGGPTASATTSSTDAKTMIITPKGSFTIGDHTNPQVLERWKSGKFSQEERDFLEKNGYKLPDSQLANLLSTTECENEADAEMNPKCEGRRSYAAFAYNLKLEAIKARNQPRAAHGYSVDTEENQEEEGGAGAAGAAGAVAAAVAGATEKPRAKNPSYRLLTDKSTLLKAVENGDLAKVKEVLAKNVDINTQNTINRKTPLIIACENGYDDIVEELINHKALEKHDTILVKGLTALGFACMSNNTKSADCVDVILDYLTQNRGALAVNLNFLNKYYDSTLQITKYAHTYSLTYLMLAAFAKNAGAIRSLLTHKELQIDIDFQTPVEPGFLGRETTVGTLSGKRTALMFAVHSSCVDCINLLLENGANPNLQSQNGNTALMMACVKPTKMETIDALLPLRPSYIRPLGPKPQGDKSTVEGGSRAVIDVNLVRHDCKSAIVLACEVNTDPLIERLLSYGADVSLLDEKSFTPLMILSMNGNEGMVKKILELLDIRTGETNLRTNTLKAFKIMINRPDLTVNDLKTTYVNYRTEDNNSALSLAKKYNKKTIVQLLTDTGAVDNKTWLNYFTRRKKRNCKTASPPTVAAGYKSLVGTPPPAVLSEGSHASIAVTVSGTGSASTPSGSTSGSSGGAAAATAATAAAAGAAAATAAAAGAAAPTAASAPTAAPGPSAAAAPGIPPPSTLPQESHASMAVPVSAAAPEPAAAAAPTAPATTTAAGAPEPAAAAAATAPTAAAGTPEPAAAAPATTTAAGAPEPAAAAPEPAAAAAAPEPAAAAAAAAAPTAAAASAAAPTAAGTPEPAAAAAAAIRLPNSPPNTPRSGGTRRKMYRRR